MLKKAQKKSNLNIIRKITLANWQTQVDTFKKLLLDFYINFFNNNLFNPFFINIAIEQFVFLIFVIFNSQNINCKLLNKKLSVIFFINKLEYQALKIKKF